MTIPEHIGLWGSIASIIGLVIAFIGIAINRGRIKKVEQALHLDVNAESESRAHATAEAEGGNQTAYQSIGPITQSVGGSGQGGFQPTKCPHLPDGENEVNASIAGATGIATHVVCLRLQEDYSCSAEGNRGRDCILIHPSAIRCQRNALKARADS